MRDKTTAVDLPTWLPPPARIHALLIESLFAGMENLPAVDGDQPIKHDLEVLRRLASDPRMQRVWHELQQHTKSDKDLGAFFAIAWQQARCIAQPVVTLEERTALAAPFWQAAKLCRLMQSEPTGAEIDLELDRVEALDMAAGLLEERARWWEGNPDSPLIVGYHTEDAVARGYVRVLGDLTRRLFGSTLRRTVATTASVALNREIDAQQVREWTRS
jgi:hypothetical protein